MALKKKSKIFRMTEKDKETWIKTCNYERNIIKTIYSMQGIEEVGEYLNTKIKKIRSNDRELLNYIDSNCNLNLDSINNLNLLEYININKCICVNIINYHIEKANNMTKNESKLYLIKMRDNMDNYLQEQIDNLKILEKEMFYHGIIDDLDIPLEESLDRNLGVALEGRQIDSIPQLI